MAPRRTYRSVKVISNNVYNNLSLNDVLCPICRSILVEPVTLPCNHGFCFSCFEGTMANASLTCPLCRVRFSSWHRVAKKENKIININLWQAIKSSFPQQLQNKLDGHEDNLDEETPRRLATPGDIRREYEAQKLREELELKKEREAEARASEELIRKIREQEEYEAAVQDEKLLFDEHVARQLVKEMSLKPEVSPSIKGINLPKKRRPLDKFLLNIKQKNLSVAVEPIPKVTCTEAPKNSVKNTCITKIMCQDKKLTQCYINRSDFKHSTLKKVSAAAEVCDSNDSIEKECRYFKPIDIKNIPPPRPVPITRVPAKIHSAATVIIGAPSGRSNFSHNYLLSAFARFEMISPILGTPQVQKSVPSPLPKRSPKKRKLAEDSDRNIESADVSIDITDTPNREAKRLSCVKNLKSPQKHGIYALTRRPGIRKSSRISSIEKTPEKTYPSKASLENSPNTRSKQKILNQIYGEFNSPLSSKIASKDSSKIVGKNVITNEAVSPPFYGFSVERNKSMNVRDGDNTTNNNVITESSLLRRKLQEESDLELARKLQDELNTMRYPTRSSIIPNDRFCKKRRQVTLDEIIVSRSRVK